MCCCDAGKRRLLRCHLCAVASPPISVCKHVKELSSQCIRMRCKGTHYSRHLQIPPLMVRKNLLRKCPPCVNNCKHPKWTSAAGNIQRGSQPSQGRVNRHRGRVNQSPDGRVTISGWDRRQNIQRVLQRYSCYSCQEPLRIAKNNSIYIYIYINIYRLCF